MPAKTLAAARLDAFAATRGPAWSAAAVVLATLGCNVPGPRAPPHATDALRRSFEVSAPLHSEVSVLVAGDRASMRLILAHGTPGSAAGWVDYLLDPPPGLEVAALDRPGFGRSAATGAVTSLAAQAAALAALLPTGGRRAILLGHSLGGAIAARVAADHPARVGALILLAASLDPALEKIHPLQRIGAWPGVRSLLPRAIANANAELLALPAELEALAADLPRITAPVVLMHGTRDDLVPVANVTFMQARLSGARSVTTLLLDGRNHFLPWNSEAQVRHAIELAREAACC